MHLHLHLRILNQDKDFLAYGSLSSFVEAEDVDFLVLGNANIHHVRDLPLYRGFHVVRDPRDVLVSAYFSHKKSHPTAEWPELIAHRDRLRSVSKSEGLMLEMEFSRPFFEDMLTWDYEQRNVLEIRMEDLTRQPITVLLRIMDHLDMLELDDSSLRSTFRTLARTSNRLSYKGHRFMPGRLPLIPAPRHRMNSLPPSAVEDIVAARTFERLTGRSKGQENTSSHLRKGVPGDWRNHFDPSHVEAFRRRYNDLVMRLGYETDPDWR